MRHHPDERNQLAQLHDRHRNFSIEVYDHKDSRNSRKLKEAKTNLEQTVIDVEALM
ncbi:MAG: hypothetical protein ACOH2D_07355 [Gelidibacter sp.]|uniref:hypothetical protein n=1 Tax=Gelidibacter sp. TaxID=2018083 RepID=UPI003266C4AC